MGVIKFIISIDLQQHLNQYSQYLDLNSSKKILSVIRFLLAEQVNHYRNNQKDFDTKYKRCRPRPIKIEGRENAFGEIQKPIEYEIKITDYIYDNIKKIKEKYSEETTTAVVTKLLHIALNEKFSGYVSSYATNSRYVQADTKQIKIHMSNVFSNRLQAIAEITGIKKNDLISLIIGNYIIENYKEYTSDYDDMCKF